MILRCSIEMPNISYAWKEPKEQLGEDIDSKVKEMVFLEGKSGVCFDIPAASITAVQKSGVMRARAALCGHGAARAQRSTGRISRLPRAAGGQSRPQGGARATEVSGDSGKEVGASADSDREAAAKVTDSETKTRSGVLIKLLGSNLK